MPKVATRIARLPRSLSGDRARLTTLRARRRAANRTNTTGTILVGLGLAAIVALGLTGYQHWAQKPQTSVADALKKSEAMRAALRYGELRLPVDDTQCAAFAFDNVTGAIGSERQVPCHAEISAAPSSATPQESSAAARLNAMSQAFKH